MDIEEIRNIARRYTPEQIESCIKREIETGKNVCVENKSTEEIVNQLSKARFIKELMEEGVSFADALRELARRIRRLQQK